MRTSSNWKQIGRVFSVISLATAAATLAHADTVYTEAGDYGRPRCIRLEHGLKNLFFKWKDSDRYSRTIMARLDTLPCGAWSAVGILPGKWFVVAADATEVQGVK